MACILQLKCMILYYLDRSQNSIYVKSFSLDVLLSGNQIAVFIGRAVGMTTLVTSLSMKLLAIICLQTVL